MSRDGKIQEPDGAPAAVREWPARRQPARLLSVVLLAVVALLAVAGGLSWLAQGRHVAELEQPLAAAKVERDTGSVRAEQRQAALNQAKAEREALDARRLELERRFAAAREDLTRLRAEAASSRAQVAAAREEPATEAWNTPTLAPASPPAAIAGTAVPTTGAAAASPPASASTAGEHATGEPGVEAIEARLASAAAADSPAAPESGPAAAGQRLTEAETAVVAPEPSAGLAAEVESLTVTFDVNSSYLPASLDGRLRRLAERLERGRRYEVELTASVGAGPVANAEDPDAAARYNAWLAERRLDRVATFLQDNAEADALAIEREFAAGDPSRRVVVRVRPLS